MVLPNFIGIGVPKAGTTTMHYVLRQHPEVFLVPQKEAHFFNGHPDKSLDWYEETFFSRWNGEPVIGDITPVYFTQEDTIRRIHDSLGPDTKIVVSFRHPLSRAYSHYLHMIRILEFAGPFLDNGAITAPGVVPPSMYAKRAKLLFDLFGRERVLPLIFERDIQKSKLETVGYPKIQKFLGLSEADNMEFHFHMGGAWVPRIHEVKEPGQVSTADGMQDAGAGDFLVTTVPGSDTGVVSRLERSVASERRDFLRRLKDETTMHVPTDQVGALTQKYFSDDIKELKELLGDDIPEWEDTNISLKAPPAADS